MLTNLTEEDIMNYLMTSEFTEGLTPDEFKFLLLKFRNFYRVSSGRIQLLKADIEAKDKEVDNTKQYSQKEISKFKEEAELAQSQLKKILERKLSWKERWHGKIIIENEIK
jgi:hypothetical protein